MRRLTVRVEQKDAAEWNAIALLKLAAKDCLLALMRLSPAAALDVIREVAPQLFRRRVE